MHEYEDLRKLEKKLGERIKIYDVNADKLKELEQKIDDLPDSDWLQSHHDQEHIFNLKLIETLKKYNTIEAVLKEFFEANDLKMWSDKLEGEPRWCECGDEILIEGDLCETCKFMEEEQDAEPYDYSDIKSIYLKNKLIADLYLCIGGLAHKYHKLKREIRKLRKMEEER